MKYIGTSFFGGIGIISDPDFKLIYEARAESVIQWFISPYVDKIVGKMSDQYERNLAIDNKFL